MIFPDDSIVTNTPENTDKILAARTSDGKIISIAYSVFRAGLQASLASGINIKTINGESILGSGNIVISVGGGGAASLPSDFFLNGKINPEYLPDGTTADLAGLFPPTFFPVVDGHFTTTGSALTKLATPVVTKGTFTETTAPLTWTAITNATSYVVQRSTDNSTWTSAGTPTANSFTDTGLTASTLYYWRIKAVGSGYADSDYSAVVNGTTSAASGSDVVAITSFSSLAPATLSGNTITGNNSGDNRIVTTDKYSIIEMRWDTSWDGKQSPSLGLRSTNEPLQDNHYDYSMFVAGNGKLYYTVNPGSGVTTTDTGLQLPKNNTSRIRLEVSGANILVRYSTNSGTSWTTLATVADFNVVQRYGHIFIWDAQVAADIKGKVV